MCGFHPTDKSVGFPAAKNCKLISINFTQTDHKQFMVRTVPYPRLLPLAQRKYFSFTEYYEGKESKIKRAANKWLLLGILLQIFKFAFRKYNRKC